MGVWESDTASFNCLKLECVSNHQPVLTTLRKSNVCHTIPTDPSEKASDTGFWESVSVLQQFLTTLTFTTFYNCIVPMGFLAWEIQVAFPGESQLRQSRYPTYGTCWVF